MLIITLIYVSNNVKCLSTLIACIPDFNETFMSKIIQKINFKGNIFIVPQSSVLRPCFRLFPILYLANANCNLRQVQ